MRMKKILENILTKEYLVECIKEGLTQQQTADKVFEEYGTRVSRQAVFYWMRNHGLKWGRKTYMPIELDAETIVEATSLVEKTLERVSEFKYELTDSEDLDEETLFILISDIHAGAKYDRTGVVDWKKILKSRFSYLKNGIQSKLRKYNMIPKKIVICLLGDLVDGFEVYPNQSEMSHPIVNDQLDLITSELMDFILFCSGFTGEVKVYGVQGNHGRISKRTEMNNWDSVVFVTLDKVINYLNRAEFNQLNVSMSYVNRFLMDFKEDKWTYLIGHGHKIMTRGALGNVAKLNSTIMAKKMLGIEHDVFMMGHVHQTRYWCNGPNSYYIANGTMYDSEHFSGTLGLPSDLRFVAFTSNEKTPVDVVWFIPLVPENYYKTMKSYLY